MISGGFSFSQMFTVSSLMIAINAGISEEIMFRAITGAVMLRSRMDRKTIWPTVIATSILFGVVHLANILGGANIPRTFEQVVFAVSFGILCGAIYVSTGSIWPSMLLHFLHDFLVLGAASRTAGVITVDTITIESVLSTTILFVILVGLSIFLLRKSRREEIINLWKEKWHMDIPETEE